MVLRGPSFYAWNCPSMIRCWTTTYKIVDSSCRGLDFINLLMNPHNLWPRLKAQIITNHMVLFSFFMWLILRGPSFRLVSPKMIKFCAMTNKLDNSLCRVFDSINYLMSSHNFWLMLKFQIIMDPSYEIN